MSEGSAKPTHYAVLGMVRDTSIVKICGAYHKLTLVSVYIAHACTMGVHLTCSVGIACRSGTLISWNRRGTLKQWRKPRLGFSKSRKHTKVHILFWLHTCTKNMMSRYVCWWIIIVYVWQCYQTRRRGPSTTLTSSGSAPLHEALIEMLRST